MGTQSHFDHIQISTKVTTEKRTLATKMALMKIMQTAIVGLCLVTLLGAFPQIISETTTLGPPEEGCYYEDKIIQEVCNNISIAACQSVTRTITVEFPTKHCIQKPVENCKYHWEKQEQRDGTIIKVWAKILSSCNTSYVDMCEDVLDTRQKEVSVEVPIEQQIPFCETITKKVANQEKSSKKVVLLNGLRFAEKKNTKSVKNGMY